MAEKRTDPGGVDSEFFQAFVELSYDWESWQALDGQYLYVTPSCCRISDYEPEEFYSDPYLMDKIIHKEYAEAWKSYKDGLLTNKKLGAMDFKITTKGGEERWIRHVCQVFDNKSLAVSGIRSCNVDITERKQTEGELELAAMYDPLTGLMNRRFISENLKHEISRCLRSENPFSLVLGDLDHFKSVNDQYGHECGDELLKHVTRLLSDSVRAQDMVSRWGGEEFLILLPDTRLNGARVLAKKLRREVEDNSFFYNGHGITMTISFGVSECDCRESPDVCIRAADKKLYEAKKRGRNRVV
jgi:diguanylate cyclase (GGDEF)-like protein/PAS domain S-box-containing protein